MPQVFAIFGPNTEKLLGLDLINEIGETLILLVEQFFDIEGRNDVAFTAISAITIKREASIQIEIRYTAGKDEYEWGRPFNPSEEDQSLLADQIICAVRQLVENRFSVSVWCKSYHKSVFKMKP